MWQYEVPNHLQGILWMFVFALYLKSHTKYCIYFYKIWPLQSQVCLSINHTHIVLLLSGLAYCRHLSTVRTHLSGLVNHAIVETDVPTDGYKGLTTAVWMKFLQDCTVSAHTQACSPATQTYLNERLCQTLIHIHLSLISYRGSIA